MPPAAQQSRHHQVVADHGGQGDGLDDDHAGCCGKPADKGEQGQPLLLMGNRQGKNKGIGIYSATGKCQLSGQGNRQDKDIYQQHIEWKHPDGTAQMLLITVFNDRHLKLAWQHQHGKCRKEGVRDPRVITPLWCEHGLKVSRLLCLPDDIAKTVIDTKGYKQSYGRQRYQLYDGLEGDRRHQTFMPLAGIQVARAE